MQWWYGHNAVAFFLTTPFLGLMYYFLPKAADRPVFSYRLSILHFWSLVFIYIWAGPHHLHYTALPEWASTLGMLFSVMLWMPSWGGMINGLLTLRGAWHRVSEDPVLKFFVVGITFYGMATFEGPMLSIKSVNALSHYTDWTIAHVHAGALGWNGFMTFGMLYWLAPRLFQTKLWSKKLAEAHFWVGTLGILLYIVAIYAAGVTQGLMWRAFDETGRLAYPDFVETVVRILPMYWVRVVGGTLYVAGVVLALVNMVMTWQHAPGDATTSRCTRRRRSGAYARRRARARDPASRDRCSTLGYTLRYFATAAWHRVWERKPLRFTVWVDGRPWRVASLFEIIPTFLIRSNVPSIASVKPYTPLELVGRDIYIARGLLQLPLADGAADPRRDRALRRVLEARRVRLRPPVPVGLAPHRPGSAPRRRQVPAPLARAAHGGPALDHAAVDHAGVRLAARRTTLDFASIQPRVDAMAMLGVPYGEAVTRAEAMARAQAAADRRRRSRRRAARRASKTSRSSRSIAYLQRLGTDIKKRRPRRSAPRRRSAQACQQPRRTTGRG